MEFAEVKRSILTEVVRNGYAKAEDLPPELTAGVETRVEPWMDKFFRAHKPEDVPITPRLINHFPIGADPEFALSAGGLDEAMVNAQDFGLQAGLAFGMDTNGRLVELRPAPSRFALEVVASILSELRWMALLKPQTREYNWISRPYFARDGLGGHIHFGRKRLGDFRAKEVGILDDLNVLLTRGGVFNEKMVMKRRQAQGAYGKLGDIRPQKHGYEYRTMPTWLDNPWLAYLTLVLSKLAVHDPGLLHGINGQVNVKRVIRNILAFYKGLDDDALIAYNALAIHGLPQQLGMDFRAAWGIHYPKDMLRPKIDYIPSSIEANPADMQTIFSYLLSAKPIVPIIPETNWTPIRFPEGYASVLDFSQTYHRVGIGEMGYNMVVHNAMPISIMPTDYRTRLQLQAPPPLFEKAMRLLRSDAHKKLGIPGMEFLVSKRDGLPVCVYLGEVLRSGDAAAKVKKFLLEGWLPLWHVDDVKPESYQLWQKKLANQEMVAGAVPAPVRTRGVEIREEGF